MEKNDDKPICDVCLGAGGEWMELNGQREKERKWVPCTACSETGRR